MKKYLLLAVCLIAVGCKGKQGAQGETGVQGFRGNDGNSGQLPVVQQLTGTVGSGTVLINPLLNSNSGVLTYLESSANPGTYVLLSIDPSNTGPWCEISYPASAVTFRNCSATSRYKILILS